MSRMTPAEMAQQIGGGLLSFPVTHFDARRQFAEGPYRPRRADRQRHPGGLSKNAANFTLYYETDRFSIRGSAAYRSGYLTQVPGSDGNSRHGANTTLNLDMQATVNLRENLKLSFEAVNLTDEFNDQYVGESNRLNVYTHSGRQYLVGLRYNF